MGAPKIKAYPAFTGNYSRGRLGNKVDAIVVHWIVGRQAAADAVFTNQQANPRSAHYSVGPKEIHRYVSERDTAWANGDFGINLRSISIEHEGGPNLPIAQDTYNNSAWLIADIWRRYGRRLPVYPHNKFRDTACPGTLSIRKLTNLADAIYEERTVKLSKSQIEKDIKFFLRRAASKADIKHYLEKPRERLLESIAETLRKRDLDHASKPDKNAGIISKIKNLLKG